MTLMSQHLHRQVCQKKKANNRRRVSFSPITPPFLSVAFLCHLYLQRYHGRYRHPYHNQYQPKYKDKMSATPNIFTRTTPRAPFKWIFHKGDFNWTGMRLLPRSPKTQIMIWKTYVSFGILLGYCNWLNSKSDNKSNFFPLKMQSRFREGPINIHDIWGIYFYFNVWGSELFGLALDIANGSGIKLRL